MSFGLNQIGATSRAAAYATASAGLARPAAPDQPSGAFVVSAVRPVAPATDASRAREQLREQVMAERGLDMHALYRLSSQDRIRAEAAITSEMALRTRQAQDRARAEVTGLGTFIDIRA
ncbi:MAG: hypothetical protein U1C74_09115 [Phenylobacterium sp.]|nr:hypothetical protein [Phenylobacterium sp.]